MRARDPAASSFSEGLRESPRGAGRAAGKGPGTRLPRGVRTIPWPALPQQRSPSSHPEAPRTCPAEGASAPGPPAPAPVTRRLPRPHSKFASAPTHWLAGGGHVRPRRSRRRRGAPPPGRPPRDARSSGVDIRASAGQDCEGGAGCRRVGPLVPRRSEVLAPGVEPLPALGGGCLRTFRGFLFLQFCSVPSPRLCSRVPSREKNLPAGCRAGGSFQGAAVGNKFGTPGCCWGRGRHLK